MVQIIAVAHQGEGCGPGVAAGQEITEICGGGDKVSHKNISHKDVKPKDLTQRRKRVPTRSGDAFEDENGGQALSGEEKGNHKYNLGTEKLYIIQVVNIHRFIR
jgi:hypothetical protein